MYISLLVTVPTDSIILYAMGTCASTSADQTTNPVKVSSMPAVVPLLFRAKQKFAVQDVAVPHGATANGRITDLVIKNKDLREMEYSDLYERMLKMKTGRYTDEEFPPNDPSIGSQSYSNNIMWKRPEAFIEGELAVFSGTIEPKDVKQGRLGDCYLMSAISLISDRPEIIKRLFERTEIN